MIEINDKRGKKRGGGTGIRLFPCAYSGFFLPAADGLQAPFEFQASHDVSEYEIIFRRMIHRFVPITFAKIEKKAENEKKTER